MLLGSIRHDRILKFGGGILVAAAATLASGPTWLAVSSCGSNKYL